MYVDRRCLLFVDNGIETRSLPNLQVNTRIGRFKAEWESIMINLAAMQASFFKQEAADQMWKV